MQTVATAETNEQREQGRKSLEFTPSSLVHVIEMDREMGGTIEEIAENWKLDKQLLTDYFAAVDALTTNANRTEK